MLIFIKSPLLQGNALTSVVKLFPALLQARSGLSYGGLVDMLLGIVTPGLALPSNMVIAQCVAAMAKSATSEVGLPKNDRRIDLIGGLCCVV